MTADDRRIAAGFVVAICGIILIAVPVIAFEEITTAWYLSRAAWLPPVVFAGRQP